MYHLSSIFDIVILKFSMPDPCYTLQFNARTSIAVSLTLLALILIGMAAFVCPMQILKILWGKERL